ncbi:TetR/AcrR family transcriptional regulator [Mycolicibacterium gadium]|uniref:TetR/AcrR family transcriptional regulator n=1 Tax=Mycolicibacterium gadium TaxID=1794 RepID=A0ABT6GLA0_MYCGU|nr:TetR/AcrR family transcriptional regulator [Mycolicibacterium gadium]MDG5482149.1 TetR/AcrR family transcriptional regulator [Mycolicibacterium gadium]
MTRPAPRRRGRPRAYDPDAALRDARNTFWRNGFAATSLDELAAGMAMNRPSIYAAFGDKRDLYRAAATDYAASSSAWLASAIKTERSLREELTAVYRLARDFYLAGDDGPRGCFLVGTALTESRSDGDVRQIVESTMCAFTATFTKRFERAQREGELAPHAPDALAQIATATLNTLALRARTGAQCELLDGLIEAAVGVICGQKR